MADKALKPNRYRMKGLLITAFLCVKFVFLLLLSVTVKTENKEHCSAENYCNSSNTAIYFHLLHKGESYLTIVLLFNLCVYYIAKYKRVLMTLHQMESSYVLYLCIYLYIYTYTFTIYQCMLCSNDHEDPDYESKALP